MEFLAERTGGHGGLILIGVAGDPAMAFNSHRMAAAWVGPGGEGEL